MKRIISLVLTLVLLVACLAVPVMADEIDNNPWIELLDYKTANNSGENFVFVDVGGSVTYDLVSFQSVYSIDVVIRFHSVVPSHCYVSVDGNQFELNMLQIDGTTYRLYGDIGQSSDNLIFSFDASRGGYYDFISVSVLCSNLVSYNAEVRGGGYAYASVNKNLNLHYYSGSSLTSATWNYSSFDDYSYLGYDGTFYMIFDFLNWNSYDYLALNLSMFIDSIDSITAFYGTDPIPFEISYVDNGSTSTGLFLVNIRLDVSGLDFSSGHVPCVTITGKGSYEGTNQVTVRYAKGYVHVHEMTSWMYWFTNLQNWLSSGFASVTNGLSTLGTNIGTFISDQTTAIGSALISHQQALIDAEKAQHEADREFWNSISVNIDNWISAQTTTLNNQLANIVRTNWEGLEKIRIGISEQTNSLVNLISSWGQSIIDSINSGADRIVAALSPNGSADDFNDKVQQQGSTLEDMAGAMGAVTRPDVSTAIPDISGYLTVTGPVTLAAVFDPFWKNSYILRLLLGSLAVSVAFTVIYGGKK